MSAAIGNEDLTEISKKVEFYLRVHRFDAAEKLIKANIVKWGKSPKLFNLLGVTYHKQSRFPEALNYFARAIKTNPKYLEASLNLAATLCDLSRYDAAREIFSSISEQVSEQPNLTSLAVDRLSQQHLENAKLYEQSGQHQEALSEYGKALSLNRGLTEAKLAVAKLYIQLGQSERALGVLNELVTEDPNLIEAYNLLGLICYKTGNKVEAKRFWDSAAKLDPDNHTARLFHRFVSNLNEKR